MESLYDNGLEQEDSFAELSELPNFHYKPTNLKIDWYKYPFRDSHSNQKLIIDIFKEIINKCIESLK